MTSFEIKMAELRNRFIARCREDARFFAYASQRPDREELIERAHKLAGLAGILGFDRIGSAALALEDAARAGHPVEDLSADLVRLLDHAIDQSRH